MTADATRWMARERKAVKEYVQAREKRKVPEESRQKLLDYAAGKAHVGNASGGLRGLVSYEGARGCQAVLDGDEGGFVWLDRACAYNAWIVRLLVRGYEIDPRPDKDPRVLMDRVAECWMHAEAIGAVAIRAQLDALITAVVRGDGPGKAVHGKDMNALCTLVAYLATGHDVGALEREGWAPIDVYAPVVAGRIDYDALAAYHQNSADTDDDDSHPPFASYPYRLAPFELLAIAKRTGAPMTGGHPLITSPLARVRDVPEPPLSDELRAVAASGAAEVTT